MFSHFILIAGFATIFLVLPAKSTPPDVTFLCNKMPEVCTNMCWAVRCASPSSPKPSPGTTLAKIQRTSVASQLAATRATDAIEERMVLVIATTTMYHVTSTLLLAPVKVRSLMVTKFLAAFPVARTLSRVIVSSRCTNDLGKQGQRTVSF